MEDVDKPSDTIHQGHLTVQHTLYNQLYNTLYSGASQGGAGAAAEVASCLGGSTVQLLQSNLFNKGWIQLLTLGVALT